MHLSAFSNRYKNRNDHHSRTMPVGDAAFAVAVAEAVSVELVAAGVASVVVGGASVAVVDAAAVAASFEAADFDSDAVRHVDLTFVPAQPGHGPLHCSSCCCYYCQTAHQHYYYAQPG